MLQLEIFQYKNINLSVCKMKLKNEFCDLEILDMNLMFTISKFRYIDGRFLLLQSAHRMTILKLLRVYLKK